MGYDSHESKHPRRDSLGGGGGCPEGNCGAEGGAKPHKGKHPESIEGAAGKHPEGGKRDMSWVSKIPGFSPMAGGG